MERSTASAVVMFTFLGTAPFIPPAPGSPRRAKVSTVGGRKYVGRVEPVAPASQARELPSSKANCGGHSGMRPVDPLGGTFIYPCFHGLDWSVGPGGSRR